MKVLVLSDIHGNLEALEAVFHDAANMAWKEIWFLGDLCGYGPEPEACFKRLQDYPLLFIPGNHDLYLCGRLKRDFFSNEAIKSLICSQSLISKRSLSLIKQLPSSQTKKRIHLVHGSLEEPSCSYILSERDAERNFELGQQQCLLYGHSHIQEYFSLGAWGTIRKSPRNQEELGWKGKRVLINPGSVGQPRDGNPQAAWGILDTREQNFLFCRSSYDYSKTQEKMKKRGFSEFLCQRLKFGR